MTSLLLGLAQPEIALRASVLLSFATLTLVIFVVLGGFPKGGDGMVA